MANFSLKSGFSNIKLGGRNYKVNDTEFEAKLKVDYDKYKEMLNQYDENSTEYKIAKDNLNRIESILNQIKEKCEENYQDTGAETSDQSESIIEGNDSTGEISYLDGTHYQIDTSKPCEKGTKYELSQDDINYLAYIASREQGSVAGAKIELSLMANLYESYRGSKYDSLQEYVEHSGWFGSSGRSGYKYPGDEYVAAVEDVLVNGNRYLPSNVDEHDCLSDITSVTVNGKSIDPSNRDAYIPYQTKITNRYGATYTFVGFAPTSEWGVKGDPFGYISE